MSKKVQKQIEKRKARGKLFRMRKKEKKESESSKSSEDNVSPNFDEDVLNSEEEDEISNDCYKYFENLIGVTNSEQENNLYDHSLLYSEYESECSESYDSDDDNDFLDRNKLSDTTIILIKQLRRWALKCKVSQLSLDMLLGILKGHIEGLPCSSKTLMKTNSKLSALIKKLNSEDPTDKSEFIYIGIARNLTKIVDVALHKVKVLKLQFNVDGLPLFKSSKLEFWPILGHIFSMENFQYKPFVIAIYSGSGKPKSLEKYFEDFIEELNHLITNGIIIKGQKFTVKVMCFICDRPARSFIKCIIGHGGYYACERCTIDGVPCNNRVVYPGVGEKRTNESFNNQNTPGHHIGTSPLIKIVGVNMVNHFVLDSMHLIYLGVMKKLLIEYWLAATKLRSEMIRLSQRLMNISGQVPCEFQRTTRSLGEIKNWKASEYRFMLLYASVIVLKNLLPENVYKHFLLFAYSCRILSSETLCNKYLSYAKVYLQKFVEGMSQIYGEDSMIMNIHNLLHVSEDVTNMKCSLSRITAFLFENKLGLMKKYIKSGYKPLTQVCKKIEEEEEVEDELVKISEMKVLKSKKSKDILSIQRLQIYNAELTTQNPNNCVILKCKTIVLIESITGSSEKSSLEDLCISGQILKVLGPALDYPSDSSLLDMYKVEPLETKKNTNAKIEFKVTDIMCKMVLIKLFELDTDPQEWYVLPLLHCV